MFDEQDRQYFYNEFKSNGYEVGSYDDFKKDLNNKEDRDWYYNEAKNMGYDVGTQADFDKMVLEPAASASPSTGGKQVVASAHVSKPQVAQPVAKPKTEYPQEVLDAYNSPDNKPGNFKDLAQLNDKYQRGELKKSSLISQALGMMPKVDAGNIGREQKMGGMIANMLLGDNMQQPQDNNQQVQQPAQQEASPESKEETPVTAPTSVVNNEGLMDAKLANYLENWKQRPDKQGTYFENMVADLLADGTANSNEEAVKMVQSALGRYANRSAMDVTNQVVASLPDDTVQDAEKSIEAQWYSHGVQDKLKQEADSMGISYDDYVAQFLKPAMVQSLVQKYGQNYRDIAEGIATRLYSHDEHVQDRLMNQDINEALSDVISKYVSPSVVDEYNKAQEAGSKAFTGGMEGSLYIPANLRLGTALGAQYEANEAKDPAKVLSGLQKKFGNLYRNPEFLNDMSNAAFKVMQRYGLNGTQSSDPKQFKPMINSVLKNELDQLEIKGMMPKGSAEYIMKTGLGNTIVGKITRKAMQTDYQNWLEDMANQQYQPGFWENVASGALTFAGDAWSYWLPGAAGGKLTKSMLAKAEGRLAGDLMAKGMESRMATRAAKLLIGKSKTEALKSGAVHGAVTFGGQSAISKPIDEVYRTGQFDENGKIYNPSVGKVIANTLGEVAKQSAVGAIMQGGTIANMVGKGRGLATNILADVGGKVADSSIMTGHQMLERMAQDPNFKPTGKDAVKTFLESGANLLSIGFPGFVGKYARFKNAREFNKKFDFTDQDIAELKRFGYEDLRDAFEKVGIGEYAVEGENAQRLDGQLTQKYMNLMNDKSVPEVLKAKMMAVVEGKRPSSFSPVVDSVIVQPMDNGGKVYLETLNKDGGIIERKEYSSLDEAQKADKKLEYEKTLGLASVLEGEFHNEFTQEHLDGLYNQAAQKYNMGEKLTDEDKAAVYLHQNAGAIKDIMDKQQKGIILTEEEQNQVDTYRHFYNSALENSSVMREFVNTFEDSHGVARGTLRKALESKDKKYAPLVESYLKELYNSIELKREMKQTMDDLYNTAHGNEQKRIEQSGIEVEKPAAPVEGAAGGQEPPVSEGPAPYQDRTNSVPSPSDAESAANLANENQSESKASNAFVMGQNAYKNGDKEGLKSIKYNAETAELRLKRAFDDDEAQMNVVAKAYEDGKDMEQFVAQRANYMTPAQQDAVRKYVEAMEANKGAMDALEHADDGYVESLKQQLSPYTMENGNIFSLTLTDGQRGYWKSKNDYGAGFGVFPDANGKPVVKQVYLSQVKEEGKEIPLQEYVNELATQKHEATKKNFEAMFDATSLKPNDTVSLSINDKDQPTEAKIVSVNPDGTISFNIAGSKNVTTVPVDTFNKFQKFALRNRINVELDAEDAQRAEKEAIKAEAEKKQRFADGIVGLSEQKPDYSSKETDPKVAAEYLQEQYADNHDQLIKLVNGSRSDIKEQIDNIRKRIVEAEDWLDTNADLELEQAQSREDKLKLAKEQLEDLTTRYDNWNKIRSLIMTEEEKRELKDERTANVKKVGIDKEALTVTDEREVPVLTDEELKKQYPAMDEASDYILSQRKEISKTQEELHRQLEDIDARLNQYLRGEADLTDEEIRDFNTTKADLEARQANLTESAKELKTQADKLKKLYVQENKKERAAILAEMTPAEQRRVKAEQYLKDGNISGLMKLYGDTSVDFTDNHPNTVDEYVASSIGRHTLNYEGREANGTFLNGLQQEFGGTRKDLEKIQVLAAEGKGQTFDKFVNDLYDNLPDNLRNQGVNTQEIRNSLLALLRGAEKYSDLKNYILKDKIAKAEEEMRHMDLAEEEQRAAYEEEKGQQMKEQVGDVSAKYSLSSETAGNGEQFYQDAEGNIDLANVPQEVFEQIGYTAAPFRLTPKMIKHMMDRHNTELKFSSPDEAIDFVCDVMNNFDHVRLGYDGALVFSIEDGRRRTGKRAVTILINNDNGKFYGLKTSGYESVKGLEKRPLLWERGANEKTSSTDAATASVTTSKSSLSSEQSGSASHQGNDLNSEEASTSNSSDNHLAEHPNGVPDLLPTQENDVLSDGKDTNNSGNLQENSENFSERLKNAIAETETEPTEAQKKAGNYKKGHLTFGGYDFTVETPKGVTRSGKDEQGKPWSVTMHDTYGYILGKIGVDGDHIDMFINDAADLDTFDGNVYVVDQVNPETGEFDEHKVMYGYPDEAAAITAYSKNYSPGWKGLGKVTSVPKAIFDKWLESSDRKTKPFREYAMIQHEEAKKAKESNEDLPFDAPMNMDDLPFHRDVKEVKPSEMTEAQKVAYDAVSTMLKKAGIPVKVVSNEDMEKVAEAQDNLNLAMLLNHPEMRFKIKTPEEKQAAENAYNFAKELRPNRWAQYAVVDMSNPNKMPEYYQKQELARKERTYLNRLMWGNYKVFNLDKSFEDNVAGLTGSFPSEFDPYKIDEQTSKKNELKKQIKETEEAYKLTGQERKEYQNQLMKEYMDEHGLASENDIPDDVWREFDYKAIEKYQDKLDSLFAKYKDLDRQLKAIVQPGVRFLRTYHGTGASFDKFDLSHALEGEGSESFGHGVYVTNSSKIGREYAQRAKNRKMEDLYKNMRYPDGVKGDIFKRRVFGEMVNDVATGGSVASAKEFAKKRVGADANDIQRTLENLKDREKGTEYEQNLKDRLAEYKEGLKWIDSLDEDYLTQGNVNRYDVDIPDDNGSNYLDWEGTIHDSLDKQKVAEDAYKVVSDNQGFNDFKATPLNDFIAHTLKTYVNTTDVAGRVEKLKSDIKDVIENYVADDDVLALNEYLKDATPDDVLATIWYNDLVRDIKDADLGEDLYRKLSTYVGDNAASQILSDNGLVGIKYPAGMIHGGAKEGDYNYVIFDENNANIVGNTKFAQGKGVVYGYTDGKEIVLNQEHLNPNTPIHEYQHLWRTAAKEMNPELIAHGDELIKQTQLFRDLKEDPNYKHLSDDEICDEAFARLTGEDGAAILEQMAKDAIKENPLDTAKELTIINRLKNWLKKFWYWTLDTFTKWKPEDIKKMTLEDIRNLVLRDLAQGVDPRTVLKGQMTKDEAVSLRQQMADNAEPERILEHTEDNWLQDFGKDGRVNTPIGSIKLGENQYKKAGREDRIKRFGLLKPTLERPDVILEKPAPKEGAERQTKYLFVKSFKKVDGTKILNFESITVKQGEDEVLISAHQIEPSKLLKELTESKMLWNRFRGDSNSLGENQGSALTPSANNPSGKDSVLNPHSDAKIRNSFEITKENGENLSVEDKIKAVSQQFGVDEADVAMYANAIKKGSTAEAARARANIKRHLMQVNEGNIFSFKDVVKYTKPINEALKENFGDLDAMIEERRKQVEAERNAMEAARKRAEEEEAKRKKHLEELSLIPDDKLDKQYMDALAKGDDATAREMLDEAARRKGYDDTESAYQGVGAWAAPGNPGYESDKARRDDWESSGSDVNLEDMALGYTPQPDDYFSHPERYSQNTPHGLESVKAINTAIDAIKNGEKDVKVKVYRAVPTSVKEGKLRNGDWVTPSKKYAEMHGTNRLDGKYRIIEDEVPATQLWWDGNDANEFGFDDGKEYKYKNAKNNRKLNDLVTYDDEGDVIPPSKRFNSRKSDIRFMFGGEKGATEADKAEEKTYRMDNLKVAEKMERGKKDAKAIKLATGWERGADGKWRYEMPDAKIKDMKDIGGGNIVKRFDDDMLWNDGKLTDVIDAPGLFEAYPQLKDVRIDTDAIMNDMPSNGVYNAKTNTITIHADDLKYMNRILNHEIQHAIQYIEGFGKGGSPEQMEKEFKAAQDEWKARAYAHELEEKAKEMGGEYNQSEVEKALVEEYKDLDMSDELPDKETRIKGFNYFARGYADRSMDDTIKRFRLNESTRSDFDSYKEYLKLAGEVESRNVEKRLGMNDEERRNSLAEETEDVPRDSQVVLNTHAKEAFNLPSEEDNKPKKKTERGRIDEATGAFKLAPNGEQSNLSKKQYIEARTKNFKDWFGGDWEKKPKDFKNKLDANGEPLEKYVEGYLNRPKKPTMPKKRKGEDEATFFGRKMLYSQALEDWPKTEADWKKRIDEFDENTLAALTPPDEEAIREKYQKQYENDMASWRKNHPYIKEGEERPLEIPDMRDYQSIQDYGEALRKHEIWKTAPHKDEYDRMAEDEIISKVALMDAVQHPFSEYARLKAMKAEFQHMRHVMQNQKVYDQNTTDAVVQFAKRFMSLGYGDDLGRGSINTLLTIVKNSTGKKSYEISQQLYQVMDVLMNNQLRNFDRAVMKTMSIKELKENAKGIQVQGKLELRGQTTIKAFRDAVSSRISSDKLDEKISNLIDKMAADKKNASSYQDELLGLNLAKQYVDYIDSSRNDAIEIEDLKKLEVENYKNRKGIYKGELTKALLQEHVERLNQYDEALFNNKVERMGRYSQLLANLGGMIDESVKGAREFQERDARRAINVKMMASADLGDKSMNQHHKENWKTRLSNSDVVRLFCSPLGSFDALMREFGSKQINGEGQLWNHFVRGAMKASNDEFKSVREANNEIDLKVSELFGKVTEDKNGNKKGNMILNDLYALERSNKVKSLDVTIRDIEGEQTYKLQQGNLMYIYMVNKMPDGAMKLREMGILDADVERIKENIDPRFLKLADWIQGEFLPKMRTKYNKRHEELFGAPMPMVENYFPLRVLKNARYMEEDVNNTSDGSNALPSTATGAIIKRKTNKLPLDILNSDALSVTIDNIKEMENWYNYAPIRKDANTLLSDTTFRNRVQNMTTIYGSGERLWNNVKDATAVAMGTYRPKGGTDLAVSLKNFGKGITGAKISGRLYTAFKQVLSAPLFLPDVDLGRFVRHSVHPYGSFKWAIENLPNFDERWSGRKLGDTVLMDDPTDWKLWHTNLMEKAAYYGMTPNALVDAVTCAVGARAVYDTKYKQYIKYGLTEERAKEKALSDAEINFNTSQQSSEGAFVSPMQLDRTLESAIFTPFRNSSMLYERKGINALRNLKHRFEKGHKEASIKFMAGQLMEEGVGYEQATKAAEKMYQKGLMHNIANAIVALWLGPIIWNLGGNLGYLMFGDDNEKKKKMVLDAVILGLLEGPVDGLAGGQFINTAIANTITSDGISLKGLKNVDFSGMPMLSDFNSMIEKFGYDKVAGAQDLMFMVMQSATGFNPKTLTDAINACIDYGNGDMTNAKEIALFVFRLMNGPAATVDNLYIDELGMKGKDAKKLSYEELAKRYAEYKFGKNTFGLGKLYSDEEKQKKLKAIEKSFDKKVSERLAGMDREDLKNEFSESRSQKEKKLIGKIIADELGTKDSEAVKKAKADASYLRQRNFSDLMDDLYLQKEWEATNEANAGLEELKGNGASEKEIEAYETKHKADLDKRKAIQKARKEMQKKKADISSDNDEATMAAIRKLRDSILKTVRQKKK